VSAPQSHVQFLPPPATPLPPYQPPPGPVIECISDDEDEEGSVTEVASFPSSAPNVCGSLCSKAVFTLVYFYTDILVPGAAAGPGTPLVKKWCTTSTCTAPLATRPRILPRPNSPSTDSPPDTSPDPFSHHNPSGRHHSCSYPPSAYTSSLNCPTSPPGEAFCPLIRTYGLPDPNRTSPGPTFPTYW